MRKIAILVLSIIALISCDGNVSRKLKRAEQYVETDPVQAGYMLDSIEPGVLRGKQAAVYAVLRTLADYAAGNPIGSDSVAKVATDYWGSRRKGHYESMSWYALGCVYSQMNKDPEAIYSLLKAKELFADTVSTYYASTLSLLGRHYNRRGLYDDAISSYSESRSLFENLDDCRMVSRIDMNIGIALFGKGDNEEALSVFERLLTDNCIDEKSRNTCLLNLAHLMNRKYGIESGNRILEYVEPYIDGCGSDEDAAPGYALKGIALYYLHETDSAFEYLRKAHGATDDLDTKILAVKGLEWVAIQMRNYQAAWNAEILNKEYQEELNKRSSQSEITQIRLQHNDEIQKQKFRSKVTRFLFLGILILIVVIAAVFIVNIQRDRRREAYYLKKYDDLIQKQIEEKANSDGNRLMEACEAFRTGIAFNLVNDVALQRRSFRQEERDVVVHDINLYFASPIAALRAEAGKLGQQEINLIFCNLLGFDQDLTADIMCTSRSNMRIIKSRLKSKVPTDTFSLYFKE